MAVFKPTHGGWEFQFNDGNGRRILLTYIVPILIALKIHNLSLYNEFVNGTNPEPLIQLYKNTNLGERLVRYLLGYDESLVKRDGKKMVSVESKLIDLYNAIFVKKYDYKDYSLTIGECSFDATSKNLLYEVESMMSMYADFLL